MYFSSVCSLWILYFKTYLELCSKQYYVVFPVFRFVLIIMSRLLYFRDERVGSLEVDGMTLVEGKSPGSLKQLNTGDEIYIGTFYMSSNIE